MKAVAPARAHAPVPVSSSAMDDAKSGLRGAITRVTGFEVRRVRPQPQRRPERSPAPPASKPAQNGKHPRPRKPRRGDRLLSSPVFILSSVRSGSTLLRVLLDSHSELYAPHELHLRSLKVELSSKYVRQAMHGLGLNQRELEHLLWDRVLDRELKRQGKRYLVNKTPTDTLMWQRILACWPDARFIYLQRHPLAMVRSWHKARPYWTFEEATADAMKYMTAMEEARRTQPGLTVRYEDLTNDPAGETKRICDYIGVEWQPQMLQYGEVDHGSFRPGMGDWGETIKSGQVQAAKPLPDPDEVPHSLREIAAAWGYLHQTAPTA